MLNLKDIKNRWNLHRYFKSANTKLLYCEAPTALLLSRLEKNVFQEVSNAIEAGSQANLKEIDSKLNKYHLCALDPTGRLRTLLKLGYLINEIRLNGQKNPIQLVSSSQPGFYKVHPGTVRVIVSSYILEQETTNFIYCWHDQLDNDEIFLEYKKFIIETPEQFLKLHPVKTEVRFKRLNESIKFVDPNKVVNFYGMQLFGLKAQHDSFDFSFLTTFDTWTPSLEQRIKFKDVVQYNGNECILSGIKFQKVNNMWIKKV